MRLISGRGLYAGDLYPGNLQPEYCFCQTQTQTLLAGRLAYIWEDYARRKPRDFTIRKLYCLLYEVI